MSCFNRTKNFGEGKENFCQKPNWWSKLKIWPKIEVLVKNHHFRQKNFCRSKNRFVDIPFLALPHN